MKRFIGMALPVLISACGGGSGSSQSSGDSTSCEPVTGDTFQRLSNSAFILSLDEGSCIGDMESTRVTKRIPLSVETLDSGFSLSAKAEVFSASGSTSDSVHFVAELTNISSETMCVDNITFENEENSARVEHSIAFDPDGTVIDTYNDCLAANEIAYIRGWVTGSSFDQLESISIASLEGNVIDDDLELISPLAPISYTWDGEALSVTFQNTSRQTLGKIDDRAFNFLYLIFMNQDGNSVRSDFTSAGSIDGWAPGEEFTLRYSPNGFLDGVSAHSVVVVASLDAEAN